MTYISIICRNNAYNKTAVKQTRDIMIGSCKYF